MAQALMSQPEKAEEPTKRIEYASQGSKVRRDIFVYVYSIPDIIVNNRAVFR